MLSPIQLDNQLRRVRNKIDNIRSYRRLTAKSDAIQSVSADSAPNNLLCFCGICAQFARTFSRYGRHAPRWSFPTLSWNFLSHDFGEATGPLPTLPRKRGRGKVYALKPPASV